jgi:hypothetical protein
VKFPTKRLLFRVLPVVAAITLPACGGIGFTPAPDGAQGSHVPHTFVGAPPTPAPDGAAACPWTVGSYSVTYTVDGRVMPTAYAQLDANGLVTTDQADPVFNCDAGMTIDPQSCTALCCHGVTVDSAGHVQPDESASVIVSVTSSGWTGRGACATERALYGQITVDATPF